MISRRRMSAAVPWKSHLDTSNTGRIPDGSSLSGQFDDNISKNIELGCAVLSHNIILHIVLGAGDPENAALGKPPEVFEVDIRLVKDDNFTFVDSHAKRRCFRRIVSPGCFYKNEIRQKGTQIQTQMHFRRRFPPAVFCPIQTVGDQLNRCRINHMDHPLEASR